MCVIFWSFSVRPVTLTIDFLAENLNTGYSFPGWVMKSIYTIFGFWFFTLFCFRAQSSYLIDTQTGGRTDRQET